jgi:hypothetical protein
MRRDSRDTPGQSPVCSAFRRPIGPRTSPPPLRRHPPVTPRPGEAPPARPLRWSPSCDPFCWSPRPRAELERDGLHVRPISPTDSRARSKPGGGEPLLHGGALRSPDVRGQALLRRSPGPAPLRQGAHGAARSRSRLIGGQLFACPLRTARLPTRPYFLSLRYMVADPILSCFAVTVWFPPFTSSAARM